MALPRDEGSVAGGLASGRCRRFRRWGGAWKALGKARFSAIFKHFNDFWKISKILLACSLGAVIIEEHGIDECDHLSPLFPRVCLYGRGVLKIFRGMIYCG